MKFFKSFRLHRRTKSDTDAIFPLCVSQPVHRHRNSSSTTSSAHMDPFQLFVFPHEPNTAHISLEYLLKLEADIKQMKSSNTICEARITALKNELHDKDERIRQLESLLQSTRSEAQYAAAISLALKTRSHLRDTKKYAKFWKVKAHEDGRNKEMITPSASDISSVHSILGTERQEALEALRARRRAALQIQSECVENALVLPSIMEQVGTFNDPIPANASRSKVEQPNLNTDAHAALSPLASQSFRQELSKHTTGSRISNCNTKPTMKPAQISEWVPKGPRPRRYISNNVTYHDSAKVIRAPSSRSRSSSGTSTIMSIFSNRSVSASTMTSNASTVRERDFGEDDAIMQAMPSVSNEDLVGVVTDVLHRQDGVDKDAANPSCRSYVHVRAQSSRSTAATSVQVDLKNTTQGNAIHSRSDTMEARRGQVQAASPNSKPQSYKAIAHKRKKSLTHLIGAVLQPSRKQNNSPQKLMTEMGPISVAQRVKSFQGSSPEKTLLQQRKGSAPKPLKPFTFT